MPLKASLASLTRISEYPALQKKTGLAALIKSVNNPHQGLAVRLRPVFVKQAQLSHALAS